MLRTAQVRVVPANMAQFGGIPLRQETVTVGETVWLLMLHEGEKPQVFALQASPLAASGAARLRLQAEWGEPLGDVSELRIDPETGCIEGYVVQVAVKGAPDQFHLVEVSDTYWWGGALYGRRRLANTLRAARKGEGKGRSRAGTRAA